MPERKDFFGENSYFGEGGHLDRQQGGSRPEPFPTGGRCGDCGGTGDCIHCSGGYYPRRDGTSALCGKCRGRGNRKHPYLCHVCKGKGYGGKRCNTPTYAEAKQAAERQTWAKYTTSDDHKTGKPQTNFFTGYVGERDQRKKVHIVINYKGEVVYVRDMDGTVLYDRREGIGHLPPDLNWSR